MIKERPNNKRYLVDIRDTIIIMLHSEMGFIQQDVAKIMGVDKATVSRTLRRRKQSPLVVQLLKKLRN